MFSIVLKLFFMQTTVLSSSSGQNNDEVLNKFICEIADEQNLQNWMKIYKKSLCDPNLFEDIVKKVSDILKVINTEKYDDIKSLIKNKRTFDGEMSYPYFKTCCIVETIRNILIYNDKQNKSNSDAFNMNNFHKELLYEEYDNIKECINRFTRELYSKLFKVKAKNKLETDKFLDKNNYNNEMNKILGPELHSEAIHLINSSYDIMESILPITKNKPVYVMAHSEGLIKSRKSCSWEIKLFENESKALFSNEMLKYMTKCDKSFFFDKSVNIMKSMRKILVCNRSTANILLFLFHYYTEMNCLDTMYEVILNENEEYQFEWCFNGVFEPSSSTQTF